jgi:CheY-like chemotaxis protein
MPGMTGFQVAQRFRDLPGSATTLLVGISGHATEPIRMQAFASGFDHFLIKPAELDHLEALLSRSPSGQRPVADSSVLQQIAAQS